MAAALSDLLQLLISKQGEEKITAKESEFFQEMKSKAIHHFLLRGSIAAALSWMVTRRLRAYTFFRVSLAGGAGFISGYSGLDETLDSCVDHVLGMDGSRMQHELRKIVLQRYGNNPQKMGVFSKHFYCEEVYNDSNPEYPRSVFRQRNLYVEDQRTLNGYDVSNADKDENHRQRNNNPNSKSKGSSMEIKQVRVNPSINMFGYADPLDIVFGYSSADEEVQPDESGVATKAHGRNHRKARRKQRMQHRHREPLSLANAQFLTG